MAFKVQEHLLSDEFFPDKSRVECEAPEYIAQSMVEIEDHLEIELSQGTHTFIGR